MKMRKKTIQDIRDEYNPIYGYIERVIRSCETYEQLENAGRWAREVHNKIKGEHRKHWSTMGGVAQKTIDFWDYMDLKGVILGQAFRQTELKIREIAGKVMAIYNPFPLI